MDNIPIEYRYRMLAEQTAMMEALQFIAQLLIYFALLFAFVILIALLTTRSSSGMKSPFASCGSPRAVDGKPDR
jgi:hypothetical protein